MKSSYYYHHKSSNATASDLTALIKDISPEVRDLWQERVTWIELVSNLAKNDHLQGSNRYQQLKEDWRTFIGQRIINRDSEFHSMFERMNWLWFREIPDWSTIKAWDDYLHTVDKYYKPELVIKTLVEHNQMLERLSGSLFQVLPLVHKRYWNEIRYLGVVERVYIHIRDMAEDASRGICYFPEDVLSRYSLKREQFLDGSCINQPEYRHLIHYWLNIYLPNFKQHTQRLLVAVDLHSSWLVLLEWTLQRHSKIESVFRCCDYNYITFPNLYWSDFCDKESRENKASQT